MAAQVTFGFSEGFWRSQGKLSTVTRGKLMALLGRMHTNPWDTTLHPEKIKSAADDRIWSARVDENYRLIWAHVQVRGKSDQIIFLYVDTHDRAYRKARRLKFQLDAGLVKVADPVETTAPTTQPSVGASGGPRSPKPGIGKLFIGYRDQELLGYGVSEDLLPRIRRLDTEDELFQLERLMPEDVFNNLIALVLGDPSLAHVPNDRVHRSLERYHGGDNLHLFINSEEFKRALEGDWEDWMVFLAPDQRRLVYADYAGPARVRGVAGSGKTVVAIHRVLHLARTCGGQGKILFLTYGNRLPGVVHHLLERLAGKHAPELKAVECITIHQWCYRMLRDNGHPPNVGQQQDFAAAVQAGIRQARSLYPRLRVWNHDQQFFLDEIKYAIKGRAITDFAGYAALERSGRGTALSATEREAMWQVYLGYQAYLAQNGLCDFEDFILKALELVKAGRFSQRYKAAVVDEIQDLNTATMMLVRAIVEPGPNDLFLVGDGLQRLYRGGYVLGRIGIDIVGRGTMLRRNYRNTQQILRAAYAMVQGTRFNDLDGEDAIAEEPEYSPRAGEPPVVRGFHSPDDEVAWVKQEIERLKREKGFKNRDFAILYRYRQPYEGLVAQAFEEPVTAITKDPQTYFGPALKTSTFDSAKGLEFKVVFLVGVTDAVMVPRDNWELEGPALEEYLARERSRLFVAMTRARDLLYITYSRGQLSRFLSRVPDRFFAHE